MPRDGMPRPGGVRQDNIPPRGDGFRGTDPRGPVDRRPFLREAEEIVIAQWTYKPEGYTIRRRRPDDHAREDRLGDDRPHRPACFAEPVRKLRTLVRRMLDRASALYECTL